MTVTAEAQIQFGGSLMQSLHFRQNTAIMLPADQIKKVYLKKSRPAINFRKWYGNCPEEYQGFNNRGVLYAVNPRNRRGPHIVLADSLLTAAINGNESDDAVQYNYAVFLGKLGRYEASAAAFYRVDNEMMKRKESGMLFFNRAICDSHLGNYRNAIENYELSGKFTGKAAGMYYNLGLAQLKLNNAEDAAHSLRKSIRKGRHDEKVYLAAGNCFAKHGKYRKAAKYFLLASKQNDSELQYHIQFAQALISAGKTEKATKSLSRLPYKFRKLAAVQSLLGDAQTASGEFENALKSYNKALKEDSTNADLLASKCAVLLLLRHFEEVELLSENVTDTAAQYHRILKYKAIARFFAGNYIGAGEAFAEMESLPGAEPDDYFTLVYKGYTMVANHNLDAARSAFRAACPLHAQPLHAYQGLAGIELNQWNLAAAGAYMDTARRFGRYEKNNLLLLNGLLLLEHRKQAAYVIARINYQNHPFDTLTLNNLGNAYVERGKPEKAISCFDRAIALAPTYYPLYSGRAMAFRLLIGKYSQKGDTLKADSCLALALADINHAMDNDVDNHFFYTLNRGDVYLAAKMNEAALADFLPYRHYAARNNAGVVSSLEGEDTQATQLYEEAQLLNPYTPVPEYNKTLLPGRNIRRLMRSGNMKYNGNPYIYFYYYFFDASATRPDQLPIEFNFDYSLPEFDGIEETYFVFPWKPVEKKKVVGNYREKHKTQEKSSRKNKSTEVCPVFN
ncbi:MAG: tetratricopeptide repeat protein [Bacteroidetes bacterium]|nr:tetratricopeptide repeat protein [Bacteroidota bacterium]